MGMIAKSLLVALMVALVPVRALAAVTVGFCAMGAEQTAAVSHAETGGPGAAHGEHRSANADTSPPGHGAPACNVCVEHCSSASLILTPPAALADAAFSSVQLEWRDPLRARDRPSRIDRPPLAL